MTPDQKDEDDHTFTQKIEVAGEQLVDTHIASVLRLGVEKVTIVTQDAQMARAAASLGFDVLDPVTDDPWSGRGLGKP